MRKLEIIIGLLAGLSLILKLLNITWSNILISITFPALAIFYHYLSFALFNNIQLRGIFKKASYKGITVKRILGAIGLGLVLSVIIIGVLFKLQSWPGYAMQLKTGILTIALILIIATILYLRNRNDYYKNFLKRIGIIGGIGFLIYLI